jgi:hypothetical protein
MSAWPPAIHQDVTDAVTALQGATPELAVAVNNQAYTIPTTGTWYDVPAMTMLVPASAAWRTEVFVPVVMNNSATSMPANGTNCYVQARVVDAATSSALYGFGIFQIVNNGLANQAWYGEMNFSQSNDPLTADTVVKLQLTAASLTGTFTYATYVVSPLTGGVEMRAVRR